MMKNNKSKIFKTVFLVLVFILFVSFSNILFVMANTKQELEQQKQENQQKLEQLDDEIGEIQANLKGALKEVQELSAQISGYEDEISILEDQIEELENSIAEAEIQLQESQEKFEYQKEMLTTRIVARYEAGETTFLDVLLSSKDISDFLTNYYYITEVAEADAELLVQIETNIKEIETLKVTLEESKQEVETAKISKEEKAKSLKETQATKQIYVNGLSEEEKSVQAEIDEIEAINKQIQADLEAYDRKNSNTSGSSSSQIITSKPYASGYIFPVQGLTVNNINRKYYPSYAGHKGTDININVVGKKVVAVKDGTVVTSKAIRNSSGYYISYGEYVIIDHHDGTKTLYAHLLSGSRTVSVGQKVVQGQVLGTVGSTGNSTGPHLHFEVRVNNVAVNPLPYLGL